MSTHHKPLSMRNCTEESFECDICHRPIMPGERFLQLYVSDICLDCVRLMLDVLEERAS